MKVAEPERTFDTKKDWSAEERFVNRSIRIRKHVLKWMESNKGGHWVEMMQMAQECANEFKPFPCASITCYRWIQQFSAKNAPYQIRGDDSGYRLLKRDEVLGS